MSKPGRDPIAVVEAAYAMTASTPESWLTGIARSALPLLEPTLGALGFLYDVHDPGSMWLRSFISIDLDPTSEHLVRAAYGSISPQDRSRLLSGNPPINTVGQVMVDVLNADGTMPPALHDVASVGWTDGVAVCGRDASGLGCIVGLLVPTRLRLTRRDIALWSRLTAHIAAGLRLRRRLEALRHQQQDTHEEAVLDSAGRLHHAVGSARHAPAIATLRSAVRMRERARGPLRTSNLAEALQIWKALVAGRWSLIDRFDSDGRRYIVAVPNEPTAPDPRGLTPRERVLAEYVALGHANKRIAYSLGIAEGTVAALVHRVLRKFGVDSRASLADMFALGAGAEAIEILGTPAVALVGSDLGLGAPMTKRQLEIVRRIAKGQTNRAIAEALGCSSSTVANTVRILFRKAGVGCRAELVRWALHDAAAG